MERAPIPPHERPWRHPSELGPSGAEPSLGGHHRAVLLATGTLTLVMVAAFVVAMTPRHSASPLAVSATTSPAVTAVGAAADAARIASFPAIPNAIAAVPNSTARDRATTAAVLPDLDDDVLVVTDHVAYALPWRDVALLEVDDAVVLGADGSVVARFVDGRFVPSADAVIGAALTVEDD